MFQRLKYVRSISDRYPVDILFISIDMPLCLNRTLRVNRGVEMRF